MKTFSRNEYRFSSKLTSLEIYKLLVENTLEKDLLVMVRTKKLFMERLKENAFSLISSSMFPYGAICVSRGEIKGDKNAKLVIFTKVHPAFIILWIIWLVTMILLVFLLEDFNGLMKMLPILLIGAFLFRLFIHGMYVLSRNNVIDKYKKVLELRRNV